MVSYIGRHVNLALLVIIIGVVIALVGTTVFFQRSLQNRTDAFEGTSTNLDQCQVALKNYQEKYSEAEQKASDSEEDIRKYDQLYDQKVGELSDAQQQLADMQKQRDFERLQKDKFQSFYEDQIRVSNSLNSTIRNLEFEIDGLEDDIRDLRDDLDACQG
jgi:chromosome segregation ATPase